VLECPQFTQEESVSTLATLLTIRNSVLDTKAAANAA
jgi:hypothetical protein